MDRRFILYSPLKSWGIQLCLKGSSISYFEAVMLHNVFKKKIGGHNRQTIHYSLISSVDLPLGWSMAHRPPSCHTA